MARTACFPGSCGFHAPTGLRGRCASDVPASPGGSLSSRQARTDPCIPRSPRSQGVRVAGHKPVGLGFHAGTLKSRCRGQSRKREKEEGRTLSRAAVNNARCLARIGSGICPKSFEASTPSPPPYSEVRGEGTPGVRTGDGTCPASSSPRASSKRPKHMACGWRCRRPEPRWPPQRRGGGACSAAQSLSSSSVPCPLSDRSSCQ
ncbi:uncharacterized protein LOC132234362 [Myotis daubentonii]|uniref:uncharacterized protein LOC132234362 n=1 Tax=Myotis daubentonii TaxID=98922 RepID=UPI002873AB58|nr:uncharacterized protein LOC132234362 [Myotis daubentonii]